MRVAVIGSGLAGLAAGWALARGHEVVVFERRRQLGMDADSLEVAPGLRVDVPLRVFYPGYYPTLIRLYEHVGVSFELVDYASSFSDERGDGYFRYRNALLAGVSVPFVRLRDVRRSVSLGLEVLRFFASARRQLRRGRLGGITLTEHLAREGFSEMFAERFLLPAVAGIATCGYASAQAYPADVVLDYFSRGLAFGGVRRVVNGTRDVVNRLAAGFSDVRVPSDVRLERVSEGVCVRHADGGEETFDHAIVAVPANKALELLAAPERAEVAALESFPYESNSVVMHRDPALAPRDRRDWAPVNFRVVPGQPTPMATIWMNAVQPELANAEPVFQTWSPLVEPRPGSVIASATFERPVVDYAAVRGVAMLAELHREPDRRVWFCGSYARHGVPLLENAARSGLEAAERLGVARPWVG